MAQGCGLQHLKSQWENGGEADTAKTIRCLWKEIGVVGNKLDGCTSAFGVGNYTSVKE
jgi:hypothetical protein